MNIFVRHTSPISKSSMKTKTVLTMTDITESIELQAFIRQKDGHKVTVKMSLCICVVLSWDELNVWQNLLDSDYEIYMYTYINKNHIKICPCKISSVLHVSAPPGGLLYIGWVDYLKHCKWSTFLPKERRLLTRERMKMSNYLTHRYFVCM